MERDFMGLVSKTSPITVEDEACDVPKDSVLERGSGMQLSFTNKSSAVPQFLSFKSAQEDRPTKAVHDSLMSSGFMTIPTAESGLTQKQGGNHYTMTTTTYGLQQFDGHQIHQSQEVRLFPVSNQPNQTITISMNAPLLQSNLASTVQSVKPQPFAGVPIMASPVSVVPPSSSVIGTTDLRNAGKSSGAPSQLTIFYAGSVCVYDVSPEKAQAIMLLAGNGSPAAQSKTTPITQTPIPRPTATDAFVGKNCCSLSTGSSLGVPLPVSSHVSLLPVGGSSGTNERTPSTRKGALPSSSNQPEHPKVVNSVGSAAPTLIPAVAVPQARKASLARFLEKRKERATSASPYSMNKKSSDAGTPGSDSMSFSVTSAGFSSISPIY